MALQTDRLVMAALGVLGDTPPNTIQPPLIDGIHLRWSFRTDVGFPWYGFFLFRRAHRPSRPVCFGQILPKIPSGPWPSAVLNTPFGQVSSDRPLVFTDDFPAGGVAEFDLRARTYVRFSLDAAQSAYRAEARLGFRVRQGKRTCIDFRPRAGFVGPNPLIEADTTFEVRGHDGSPAAQTQVIQSGTLAGLHCGHRLEILLPCKASAVELTLAHFSSPGRLLALNSAGSVVATASLPTQQGVPHVLHLSGQDIVHARSFLPEADYQSIDDVRVLRKSDGTAFVVIVPSTTAPGSQLEPADYRLRLTYRRDNQALDPGSLVFSQAGVTADEVVTLDVPWSSH